MRRLRNRWQTRHRAHDTDSSGEFHIHFVMHGEEQRILPNRNVAALRLILAVERDDEALHRIHAIDVEHPLVDLRIANGFAERPAMPVVAAAKRVEVASQCGFDIVADLENGRVLLICVSLSISGSVASLE